jgi:hypothetical protein
MATLSIESNGMLERTAVYYNGSQISGIKELMISLDEDGTFDTLIQYEGIDKEIYTKNIFTDHLTNIKTVPPSFTEEESMSLQLFTVESDGDIGNTTVFLNEESLDGVVNVLIHIKAKQNKSGLSSLFAKKEIYDNDVTFKSEITYRNEDESLETEDIFL